MDFDLCEPIPLKANEKTKAVAATFINMKGLKTSFKQTENSSQTISVSNNQVAGLDEGIMKTEPPVEESKSQSEPEIQKNDVGPSL